MTGWWLDSAEETAYCAPRHCQWFCRAAVLLNQGKARLGGQMSTSRFTKQIQSWKRTLGYQQCNKSFCNYHLGKTLTTRELQLFCKAATSCRDSKLQNTSQGSLLCRLLAAGKHTSVPHWRKSQNPSLKYQGMECVTTSILAYGGHRGHQDALLRCNATCRFFPCTAASKDLTNGIPKHDMAHDGHLVQTYTLLHTCQNLSWVT